MARGFAPVRHLNGSNCFSMKRYRVDDSIGDAVGIGDMVSLSSGAVIPVTANNTLPVLGAVGAIFNSDGRPKTHATSFVLAATEDGFVGVYDDPDIVYEVSANTTAAVNQIGQIGTVVANASASPATGRSAQILDVSSLAAETTANSDTLDFKLVGPGRRAEVENGSGAYGFGDKRAVEVVINNHTFRARG